MNGAGRIAELVVRSHGRLPSVTIMTIVPDDKNWTWVLEETCPECEFAGAEVAATAVADLIREQAKIWPGLLQGDAVAQRPRPDKWSPLEYGCHVRDVFRLYEYRLRLMLDNDDPLFPNWDQDATAIEQRYEEADPQAVAADLVAAAHQLADSFDSVSGATWQRAGRRSDGVSFTIDSFARYLIHDPIHHVHDVRSGAR
jgi:hypothetical protein